MITNKIYNLANEIIKDSKNQIKYLQKGRYTDVDLTLIGQADGRLSASKDFLRLLKDNEENTPNG
jgi:hypothetical protein|tara:strand:- start:35 stop:229 length:195 start_codon:yes stop_codon:yes gene_type:complete